HGLPSADPCQYETIRSVVGSVESVGCSWPADALNHELKSIPPSRTPPIRAAASWLMPVTSSGELPPEIRPTEPTSPPRSTPSTKRRSARPPSFATSASLCCLRVFVGDD